MKAIGDDIDALRDAVDKGNPRVQVGDLESGSDQLPEGIALLKIVTDAPKTDVTLNDPPLSVAAQALESMAREVCGPILKGVLDLGPYEDDIVSEIQELTRAIDWASERALACHDQAAKEA